VWKKAPRWGFSGHAGIPRTRLVAARHARATHAPVASVFFEPLEETPPGARAAFRVTVPKE